MIFVPIHNSKFAHWVFVRICVFAKRCVERSRVEVVATYSKFPLQQKRLEYYDSGLHFELAECSEFMAPLEANLKLFLQALQKHNTPSFDGIVDSWQFQKLGHAEVPQQADK